MGPPREFQAPQAKPIRTKTRCTYLDAIERSFSRREERPLGGNEPESTRRSFEACAMDDESAQTAAIHPTARAIVQATGGLDMNRFWFSGCEFSNRNV